MAIDAHIEELRAELKGCLNAAERARIAAELAAALAQREADDG
jgi:hypothetical protein